MTEPTDFSSPIMHIMPDPPVTPPEAFLCERCGTNRVEYVVSSLANNDTSQYCGTCIILVFMGAGEQMFREVMS